MRCNTLQHCNTLQLTATHCNTLQHTATLQQRNTPDPLEKAASRRPISSREYALSISPSSSAERLVTLENAFSPYNNLVIVLQCVAVCASVLQCVAVCCSVLQCDAVCCSMLQYVKSPSSSAACYTAECILRLHGVVCCSVLQCDAVRCSVIQCVALCDSVL